MATLTNGGAIMAVLLILAAAYVIVAYTRHTRNQQPQHEYAPACISDVAPLGTFLAHSHGVYQCEPYDQETA